MKSFDQKEKEISLAEENIRKILIALEEKGLEK
jgi:hypothetical protein